jgi:hypothetical protein
LELLLDHLSVVEVGAPQELVRNRDREPLPVESDRQNPSLQRLPCRVGNDEGDIHGGIGSCKLVRKIGPLADPLRGKSSGH